MKRRQFLRTVAGSTAALSVTGKLPAGSQAEPGSMNAGPTDLSRPVLWYLQPAKQWIQALPVGNGRLGAMVFGNTENERIQLNEETVWSGGPYDPSNPKGPAALPQIRKLVFAGEYVKAHRMFGRTMFGLAIPQMQYQPLADLWLIFPGHNQVSEYHRQLDLDEAIVTVKYRVGKVRFTREVFSSPVDQVIVVRLTADQPGQLTLNAALPGANSPQRDGDAFYDALARNELVARGRAMSDQGIEGRLRFKARARVMAGGGTTTVAEESLTITGANAVTILIAAATSFVNYQDASGDPEARITQDLEKAAAKSYAEIRNRHVAEHQRLFRRVHLDLGSSEAAKLPTDERLKRFKETNDPGLMALYFQYGRYLLMSSSRPGCKPANLQGIWNDKTIPPWGGKWTTNINLEMNYWPVEVTNLSECAEPLPNDLRPRATGKPRGEGELRGAGLGLAPEHGPLVRHCPHGWSHLGDLCHGRRLALYTLVGALSLPGGQGGFEKVLPPHERGRAVFRRQPGRTPGVQMDGHLSLHLAGACPQEAGGPRILG